HSVAIVDNGREALAALAAESFHVVLMDIQMPELDGFEVTRAIRAGEADTGRHQPIIAMTAHAMKGDRERCLANGMDNYVTKPINSKDLFTAIRLTLQSLRPFAEAAETTAPPQPTPVSDKAPTQRQPFDRAALAEYLEQDQALIDEIMQMFVD